MTFKLHPLHTPERHFEVMRCHGVVGYHEWLAQKRSTGRSTALALQYIAEAIEKPHTAILLADHPHQNGSAVGAKKLFAERVLAHAKSLGLLYIHTQLRNSDYFLIFGDDSK